ncbi:MAG: class I SAM-dependent methyltransferase [Gammaproteobacteria bacterium]|nr:class I SAM-dependent methyltransferase [Gammaproteobacteria bacterium]
MNQQHQAEHLFKGAFAEEYNFLSRICPAAPQMSERVAQFVARWRTPVPQASLKLLELGCGTGITTNFLAGSRTDLHILAVDNAPAMLSQAREFMAAQVAEGRLDIREIDALGALGELPDGSIDIVASAYTLHNFLHGYRRRVLAEIFRVLRPGGVFVNGDRYAMDDPAEHLENTQNELRGYFRVFLDELNRPDLLEQWVIHHFSDESEEHLMRLRPSLEEMAALGFTDTHVHFRDKVNTLVSGVKPWR